jgi:hypothetical protein
MRQCTEYRMSCDEYVCPGYGNMRETASRLLRLGEEGEGKTGEARKGV